MNKVILLGRLTKDPEIRYTSGNSPMMVARYTLAVNRRFKKQGESEADFINCVTFGKNAEFAQKYLNRGRQIGVVGRLQVSSWEDNSGKRHWSTDVIVEEHYFADSKTESKSEPKQEFYTVDDVEDEDLPF